jgi:Ser/Thr protein kinase RdoA (MazF antagonist)
MHVERAKKGRTNHTFVVSLEGRPAFVLRVAQPARAESIRRQTALLARLRERSPPPSSVSPEVLGSRESPRGASMLLRYEHGVHAKPADPRVAPGDRVIGLVGGALARLHAVLDELSVFAEWPCDHRTALASLEAPPLDRLSKLVGAEARRQRRSFEHAVARTAELLETSAELRPIHGDVRFANVLFEPEDGGVVVFLDFDRAGPAPRALEHATALFHLLAVEQGGPERIPPLWHELAECYCRHAAPGQSTTLADARAWLVPVALLEATEVAGPLAATLPEGRVRFLLDRCARCIDAVSSADTPRGSLGGWAG